MSNNVAYNPAYPGVYYYYNHYYKNWGIASNTPYNVPYNHVYNWNYQIGYNQPMDSNNLDDSDDGSDVGPCMSYVVFVGKWLIKHTFFSFQEPSSFCCCCCYHYCCHFYYHYNVSISLFYILLQVYNIYYLQYNLIFSCPITSCLFYS